MAAGGGVHRDGWEAQRGRDAGLGAGDRPELGRLKRAIIPTPKTKRPAPLTNEAGGADSLAYSYELQLVVDAGTPWSSTFTPVPYVSANPLGMLLTVRFNVSPAPGEVISCTVGDGYTENGNPANGGPGGLPQLVTVPFFAVNGRVITFSVSVVDGSTSGAVNEVAFTAISTAPTP